MDDQKDLRKWLIENRSKWAQIAQESGVSVRTMANVVNGTDAHRRATLICLGNVKREWERK